MKGYNQSNWPTSGPGGGASVLGSGTGTDPIAAGSSALQAPFDPA